MDRGIDETDENDPSMRAGMVVGVKDGASRGHRTAQPAVNQAVVKATGNEVRGREPTPQQLDDPYAHRAGPPLKYPREIIERALFEVAAHAGNARRAHIALKAQDIDIPPETMYGWIKGRFRNRYGEIRTQGADKLREEIARQAIDLSLEAGEAERQAIQRALAGLADANGVEASIILRNLTTSKGINLDQEGKLRGRAGVVVDHRGLEQITEALLRLGVAQPVVVDAEVIED